MKKSFNIAAMMSLGLGLLSALPAAQAAGTQSIAVSVSARVQSPDFNVSAVPGSIWLAAGSSSQLASSKDVSLKLGADKKSMTLDVAGAGVSNKSIKLEAAKGKSLQAMVTSASIYNTASGAEVPLKVTINGTELSSTEQVILAKDDVKDASKVVMMDVAATSAEAFAEGDYKGTMTVVFSAGA